MSDKFYQLPPLPYPENFLEPSISSEQLRIHHDKHHSAYVAKANEILGTLSDEINDPGTQYKKLSFNVGGHVLHTLFWENLAANSSTEIKGLELESKIVEEFRTVDYFKKVFGQIATTIEGSGWAALFYCPLTGRLLAGQIGNHNLYIYPTYKLILVLDMWEHAYYIDYKNDKASYVNNYWQIVNWQVADDRFKKFSTV